MSSREDHRFVSIYTQPRDSREGGNERESGVDLWDLVCRDGKIISKTKKRDVRDRTEGVKEEVI